MGEKFELKIGPNDKIWTRERGSREQIFIEKESDINKWTDITYWEEQNAPIIWVKEYDKDGIIVHSDMAYGKLRLEYKGEISIGDKMVYIDDIVVFSEYYTEPKPYVPFRRIE